MQTPLVPQVVIYPARTLQVAAWSFCPADCLSARYDKQPVNLETSAHVEVLPVIG